MKNLKKAMAIVAAFAVAASAVLAAPKVQASEWEGAEKAATMEGEIQYMHSGDDYEREMYAGVFESYMQLAPNVKVEQIGN